MVAWSYSALNAFETCAYRYYKVNVCKHFKEIESEQMRHGNRVHRALEARIKDRTPLPNDLGRMEGFVTRIEQSAQGGRLDAEQKLALNKGLNPVKYFAPDVWVRVITDFTLVKGNKAFVGDWKTGNPTPESAQLRLCAAATFAHLPYVDEVKSAFVWLKTDEVTDEKFTREDVPRIWQEFAPRVQRLEIAFQEQKWPKKPSGLCRKHCPVTECEFHGG